MDGRVTSQSFAQRLSLKATLPMPESGRSRTRRDAASSMLACAI
jgi:hypothetical protein